MIVVFVGIGLIMYMAPYNNVLIRCVLRRAGFIFVLKKLVTEMIFLTVRFLKVYL